MNVRPLAPFADVLVIEPPVFSDNRGRFREIFRRDRLRAAGLTIDLVQINHSFSHKGVLRGLHFQHPAAQGKLIAAVSGIVFDVAVDVRVGSPTFGRWAGHHLTGERGEQLYLPPGFAHGFLVLSDAADLVYGCTELYNPATERVLAWNDADVGAKWPATDPLVISERDGAGESLARLKLSGALPSYDP